MNEIIELLKLWGVLSLILSGLGWLIWFFLILFVFKPKTEWTFKTEKDETVIEIRIETIEN